VEMIEIIRIDASRKEDINMPNEPFTLWGKMVPTYDGEKWQYTTQEYEDSKVYEMVFPDESYDYYKQKEECFFVGAYTKRGVIVGLGIYRHDWLKYMYLEDIKIAKEYRGQGIGKRLLEEGKKIAIENGYQGIYTIGQDNNLSACLFYIKSGFSIGGLNTHVYRGSNQADKSDIYFYLDN